MRIALDLRNDEGANTVLWVASDYKRKERQGTVETISWVRTVSDSFVVG